MKLCIWRLRAAKRDHTTELNHGSYNAGLPHSTEWAEGVGVSGSNLPDFIDLPHIKAGGEWPEGAYSWPRTPRTPIRHALVQGDW
jgi:hypothetical protein